VAFCVERYAGLQSNIPLHTERHTHTHTTRYAAAITTINFYNKKKGLNPLTLKGTYELPEDDLNNDRNMLECF
jgi:hypothetical protein